jgi:hypothetical protein
VVSLSLGTTPEARVFESLMSSRCVRSRLTAGAGVCNGALELGALAFEGEGVEVKKEDNFGCFGSGGCVFDRVLGGGLAVGAIACLVISS